MVMVDFNLPVYRTNSISIGYLSNYYIFNRQQCDMKSDGSAFRKSLKHFRKYVGVDQKVIEYTARTRLIYFLI